MDNNGSAGINKLAEANSAKINMSISLPLSPKMPDSLIK